MLVPLSAAAGLSSGGGGTVTERRRGVPPPRRRTTGRHPAGGYLHVCCRPLSLDAPHPPEAIIVVSAPTSHPHRRSATVVGGGITGLLTAVKLADAGLAVSLLEAEANLGGQVRHADVAGTQVDVGAESLYTAIPGVTALLERLRLDGDVVRARPGPTWVATAKGLRRLPSGMGPAGPSRLWPVVTSGILSPVGLVRAACEPLVPRSHHGQDLAVGDYLGHRFGTQLTDRLIDPLLGNLHAGDVRRLSLAAATPALDHLARRHRSLVLARRRGPGGPPGSFVSLRGGLTTIVTALASDPRITIRRATPVTKLERRPGGYRLLGPSGVLDEPDEVVLAVPPAVAARLVAGVDPVAAELLEGFESASVATVVAAYPRGAIDALPAFGANGVLIPTAQRRTLKAATFLSSKWPHIASGELFLVRMSAGRAGEDTVSGVDDGELVGRLHADLAALTGLGSSPTTATVQRWPDTMPQLLVGHLSTVRAVRERLEGQHRIALAGAAYDGVGIGSALRAADRVVDRVVGSG